MYSESKIKAVLVLFYVLCIVGIFFSLIMPTIRFFIKDQWLIRNGLETTATVNYRSKRNGRSGQRIYIYVDYIIDDIRYDQRLEEFSYSYDSTYIGMETVILYKPENPKIITQKRNLEQTKKLYTRLTGKVLLGIIQMSIFVFAILSKMGKGKR